MGHGVIPDSFIPEPPNGRVEFGATADQFLIAAYDGTAIYGRRKLRLQSLPRGEGRRRAAPSWRGAVLPRARVFAISHLEI